MSRESSKRRMLYVYIFMDGAISVHKKEQSRAPIYEIPWNYSRIVCYECQKVPEQSPSIKRSNPERPYMRFPGIIAELCATNAKKCRSLRGGWPEAGCRKRIVPVLYGYGEENVICLYLTSVKEIPQTIPHGICRNNCLKEVRWCSMRTAKKQLPMGTHA